MKKFITIGLLLFAFGCGDTVVTNCPPPDCPTCPAPEQPQLQLSLTSWFEPDHFVIHGTTWIGEPMLTLPAKFKTSLLQKNKPSYILKVVESEIQNEQTSSTQWAANSGALNVDYTPTPPAAGDVILSAAYPADQENLTGNTWTAGMGVNDVAWQSFQHAESGTRVIDNIKIYHRSDYANPITVYLEIWSAGKSTKLSSTAYAVLPNSAYEGWTTFYFTEPLSLSPSTEYWIRTGTITYPGDMFIRYQNTNVYASGQFDFYDGDGGGWSLNLGDLMFEVQFLPVYSTSGYIQTQIMDMGSVPTVDGLWRFETLTPQGTSVAYEAWTLDALPGTAWTLVQQLGSEQYVYSLANLGGGVVVAGTDPTGHIYRSTDNGASWSFVQRPGTETSVRSLSNLGGGIVLAGTNPTGQIYRSTNSGASWSFVQRLGTETIIYSLENLGGGVVVAGTTGGNVYRSTDSGASWSFVQRLGTETIVYSLANLGGGVVVAGTTGGNVYRSTDSGASWSFVQRLGTETAVWSLENLGNSIVVAGTSPTGHIYRSTDNGASWSFVQRLGTETYVTSLSKVGGGIVVAGTATTGHIYRSTNSGASWSFIQRLGTEAVVYSLAVLDGVKLLAGTNGTGQIYHGGLPTSLGTVVDGQAISVRSRYYAVKATLTADSSLNYTPTIKSIMDRFPTYLGFSDNTRLGYEAALQSVTAFTQSIDDFKPSAVGQVQATLDHTWTLSNWLSLKYPKNKEAKILIGFDDPVPFTEFAEELTPTIDETTFPVIYEGLVSNFLESDYLLYYTGIVKGTSVNEKDQVTLKIDDLHIEWDAPVPRQWASTLDDVSWTDAHPADVMVDIIQSFVTSYYETTRLRGYISINQASFNTVKSATVGWKVSRIITGQTAKARDLLDELRQTLSCYFMPLPGGDVKLAQWDPDAAAVMELTDRDFITKKWDGNEGSLINRTAIYYEWIKSVEEPTWYASVAYKKGDYIVPTTGNGRRYECTAAGTSGGTEPTWGTTVGGTTTDNTITWTCRHSAGDDELRNYLASDVYVDVASVFNYGELATKIIKDKWTRQSQLAQVQARRNDLIARYKDPAEKITATVDMRFFELEPGDMVSITTRRAPSFSIVLTEISETLTPVIDEVTLPEIYEGLVLDMPGITAKKFQVVSKQPNFANHTIGFTFLRA